METYIYTYDRVGNHQWTNNKTIGKIGWRLSAIAGAKKTTNLECQVFSNVETTNYYPRNQKVITLCNLSYGLFYHRELYFGNGYQSSTTLSSSESAKKTRCFRISLGLASRNVEQYRHYNSSLLRSINPIEKTT